MLPTFDNEDMMRETVLRCTGVSGAAVVNTVLFEPRFPRDIPQWGVPLFFCLFSLIIYHCSLGTTCRSLLGSRRPCRLRLAARSSDSRTCIEIEIKKRCPVAVTLPYTPHICVIRLSCASVPSNSLTNHGACTSFRSRAN